MMKLNLKFTKKQLILISLITFFIIIGVAFTCYVINVKNPADIKLTSAELHEFIKISNVKFPESIIKELPYPVEPAELDIFSGSAILIDASNGCVLYEKNADEIIPPASMTKLVVMYVVFQEIATGRISLDDIVPLPPESWAINAPPMSSLMFLGEGQTVTLRELLLGLAVASGNDAAIAVAHYTCGSVESFVERMNSEMEALGLVHTRFVEPSGYSELNLTTPREFAAFAKTYIERYPESLTLFHSQPSISYPQEHNLASWHKGTGQEKPIFQQSTNKLLNILEGYDGLKTGFIFESGYNLSLTAQRNGTRFISVTMKGPGKGSVEGNKYRISDSMTLMEWAFSCFATRKKDDLQNVVVPVLCGKKLEVLLAPVNNENLTVPALLAGKSPKEAASAITVTIKLPKYVKGPINIGDVCGVVVYALEDAILLEVPLVATQKIEETNFIKKIIDNLVSLFL